MSKKQSLPLAGIAILLVLLIVGIVLIVQLGKKEPAQEPAAAAGLSYLQSLEQQDPAAVDQILKDQRYQEFLQRREQRLRQLESGETSVWSLFEDYVLLGDSRAEGFGFYEYLSKDRCLAEMGTNIDDVEDHLDQIKALNPSMVFLSFGINDLLLGVWPTAEDYAAEYQQVIGDIRRECPDAKIYINSIIPSLDWSSAYAGTCDLIPDYNEALKALCDRTDGCYYIDNDAIAQEHTDLYESDGIHFVSEFYPIWATNMIMEVYDSENEISEDSAA